MNLVPIKDFETVKAKYIEVIENTPGIAQYARWVYGKHPTDELLRSYMDEGAVYVLKDRENIAGTAVILMYQGQDYETVPWAENLANDQVATLHLLAVAPDYRGQNTGRRMLDETVRLAVKNGKKALRLDTLKCNLPARHLYEKTGFTLRGEQYLYAENTGWTDFLYYEKLITPSSKEN